MSRCRRAFICSTIIPSRCRRCIRGSPLALFTALHSVALACALRPLTSPLDLFPWLHVYALTLVAVPCATCLRSYLHWSHHSLGHESKTAFQCLPLFGFGATPATSALHCRRHYSRSTSAASAYICIEITSFALSFPSSRPTSRRFSLPHSTLPPTPPPASCTSKALLYNHGKH